MATLIKPLKAASESHAIAAATIALGVVIAILYFGRVFFITSLTAIIIAFILEPFVAVLMRLRLPRSLAAFVVCTVALTWLYVMGLGAYSQISGLLNELPKYSERIGELVEAVEHKAQTMEQQTYELLVPARQRKLEQERLRLQAQEQQQAAQSRRRRKAAEQQNPAPPNVPPAIPEVRIHEERTPLSDYVYNRLGSVYEILLMVSFVPFLVYFMLSWRDHIHRSFLQLFQGEDRMVAARSLQGIADLVRAFVVGNFLLGLLLAMASSLAFWLIRLPYPLLVGPLSGFLSLVPYIGLPLAAIPPLFVALTAFHTLSGYLLVFFLVAVFHLLALNLLYPKVVGSRVHLNPLVVTFSLMIWGFLWDAAGLLLAIPLTAALKAVCDNVRELRPIGKFLGD
ncbi:MAG TPA: AI-2E family transporter [Bryobacteraceae bacterium]|nr:AI-2E family transporter [Bryobacteraceae bacterium]